jgi:hypothetical protein
MGEYLLGLATLPVLAALVVGAFFGWIAVTEWLDQRHGLTFDFKGTRRVNEISDYRLRHDIWWERSFGPVFIGGWYREPVDRRLINRWVGIGRTLGPCFVAYRSRDLGPTTATPAPQPAPAAQEDER